MVWANVKIIEELQHFLEKASTDATMRKLITQEDSDFTRNRKLPISRLASLIINMPKRSLSIEIQEFFDSLQNNLQASTKGAFSLQRTKLKALFLSCGINGW